MDYKELIERLRKYPEDLIAAYQAAAAIETLLAEREAAVSALKKFCDDTGDGCELCKHMPCAKKYGRCIGWEWHGPQKER